MKPNNDHTKLYVYFDGACYLCSAEISIYQKKDLHHVIGFVDISKPAFDAKSEGLDPVEVNRSFHVKKSSGEIVAGVAGFVEIWQTLGIFKPLVWFSKIKITRSLMELGYLFFKTARPYLPRRKSCETDVCHR